MRFTRRGTHGGKNTRRLRISVVNFLSVWSLHEVERAGDVILHVAAVYDGIKHSVLQQEFAALETFG